MAEDGSTQDYDGGTVLLGGSPLRLFRISSRARALVARWNLGTPVGPSRGAQMLARRLVSAGAFFPRPVTSTCGPEDVTVVVPVRDRPAQLDRLLDALDGLACVVVDDASADAAAIGEIAERHGARFVRLASNAGPSGARNAGMERVDSTLVAFVDSDCVPAPGWLGPLLGHFDDPLVAAVAPRIVPGEGGRTGALSRYEAIRSSLDRGPREGLVRQGSPIPFVPSAALLVRADVATGPELFDVALRGGEDVDLVWRLNKAGWEVRYVPASIVAHEGPTTLGSFLGRRAFYGTTAGPLARRHGDALAPVHVSGWSLAVWTLALDRRPVLALATLALSIAILANRLTGLVRDPVRVATRIAGAGTACSALPSLAGLARAWSPALVLGLAFRRTRKASAFALALPALGDWVSNRETLDPVRFCALHLAGDLAYGTGVWVGLRVGADGLARDAPSLMAGTCVVVTLVARRVGAAATRGSVCSTVRVALLIGLMLPDGGLPEGGSARIRPHDDRMNPARPERAQAVLGLRQQLAAQPVPTVGGRHHQPVDRPAPTVPAPDHGADDLPGGDSHDERALIVPEQVRQRLGGVRGGGRRGRPPQCQHPGDVFGHCRPQNRVHRVMLRTPTLTPLGTHGRRRRNVRSMPGVWVMQRDDPDARHRVAPTA